MRKFNLSVCLLALSAADAFGYCTMTHMKNCGLDWGYNDTKNEYVLGELDTEQNCIKKETELRTYSEEAGNGTSLYDSFNNCGVLINQAYNDVKYKKRTSQLKLDNLDPAQQNGLMIYLIAYNFFKEQNSKLSEGNFWTYYNAAKELIGNLTLDNTVRNDVWFYLFNEKWNAAKWMAEVKEYRSQNHEILNNQEVDGGVTAVKIKNKKEYLITGITTRITTFCTDMAGVKADAIVNAANSRMQGGSGADASVHINAGYVQLKNEEARYPYMSGGRCPTGEAKVTWAHLFTNTDRNVRRSTSEAEGKIKFGSTWKSDEDKYFNPLGEFEIIVHTVGPTSVNETLLQNSYLNSLKLAEQQGARTIVIPAISTGIYGYPLGKAAFVAANAVVDYVKAHPYAFDEIGLVFLPSESSKEQTYADAISKKINPPQK